MKLAKKLRAVSLVGLLASSCAGSIGTIKTDPVTVATELLRGAGPEYLSEMADQALSARQIGNRFLEANSFNAASYAARALGRLQLAIEYGRQAAEAADRGGEVVLQARAYLNLVDAYVFVGQHEKSATWIDKGIDISKKIAPNVWLEREAYLAEFYVRRGSGVIRKNRVADAIEYFELALRIEDHRLSRVRGYPTYRNRVVSALSHLREHTSWMEDLMRKLRLTSELCRSCRGPLR